MRTSKKDRTTTPREPVSPPAAIEVAHDEAAFFESFYKANVQGGARDWMTIGSISEPEARFHYNATENSIIRALSRLQPLPSAAAVRAWRMMRIRARLRHLDIGSGTGHWIDFMRDVFLFTQSVGIEITDKMSRLLRQKYSGVEGVTIHRADLVADEFGPDLIGGRVDLVTAIGVMFHIVDDERWVKALHRLAAVLKEDALLLVGGEFGSRTRNVQFHRDDHFESWKEFSREPDGNGEIRVNKRVRSLGHWSDAAAAAGLMIVDVIRSEHDPDLTTPENDLLVLKRR